MGAQVAVAGVVRDVWSLTHARGDAAVAAIAARQYGAISLWQLLQCGLTRSAIAHRVKTGRLHPLHRGVYAVGHRARVPLQREMAAVLAAGPHAFLSHGSAAYLWALANEPAEPPHVTLAAGRCRKRGLIVHRAPLGEHDRSLRYGIPLTSPARTILDLATEETVEQLAAEAEALALTTFAELQAAAEEAGRRPGAARLRALLATANGPALTRSEAERRFLALIRGASLAEPEVNARVDRYEVDFLWRRERLAVEIDGWRFHSGRKRFEDDRARGAALTAAGLRVMHVTWRQLVDEPYAVIARVAQALARD